MGYLTLSVLHSARQWVLSLLTCLLLVISVACPVKEQPSNPTLSITAPITTTDASSITLKVHYIDVGQADCILIQIPNGKNVLIDAGNNEDAADIVAYLKKLKVTRLDEVIGTHPHEDHIGALDTVINTFDIGEVIMPSKLATTKTMKDVITAIKNKGLKITEAKPGLKIELGPEVVMQVFAPNSDEYKDLNNYSVVIHLKFGETAFIFTGDAEDVSEREMIQAGYHLKADVLKVGHHGSNSSTTPEFLEKVSSIYAVISVGKNNKFGHPSPGTLNKLTNAGIKVYRTDESGTIRIESDGKKLTVYPSK